MKKIFKKIAYLFSILMVGFLMTTSNGWAQNSRLNLPVSDAYGGVVEENKVIRAVDTVAGSSDFLESAINVIFTRDNIVTMNIIIGIVAIAYFVGIGLQFVLSGGKEDVIKKLWSQFAFVIVGLVTISVAQIAAFVYLNPDTQVNPFFLVNQNVVSGFEAKAMQVKFYIQVIVGGLALLSILTTGYRLMTSLGAEDVLDKEKQIIKNFFLAAAIILSSEILVRGVFFIQGQDRTEATNQAVVIGVRELVGLANSLLTIVAALSVFMLILSSLYYVVSLGDDDRVSRAKRIIFSTVIAIIICFCAFTLLHFFIGQ